MAKKDQDTEQKIKEAARIIFLEKGFASTKTRDIAEAAGINLALLNYYFRSKKKLFDLIMIETLQTFFSGLVNVLDDESSTLKAKVEQIAIYYMDLLNDNPNVASFILNSIRDNPEEFVGRMRFVERAKKSYFVKQFQEAVEAGLIPQINPINFMLNMMGLTVFPYIVQPMICEIAELPKEVYFEMIQERKRLIPLWIESMLSVK